MLSIRRVVPLAALAILSLAATAGIAGAQVRSAPAFQPAAPAPVAMLVRQAHDEVRASLAPGQAADESAFARSGFGQFMASPAGRVLRVVAGVGMIAGGIAMDSNGGNALAIAGAVPLSAGLFDICWLSPIFGGPFKGADIRAAKK
jgi:hypothetical protein